MKADFEKGTKVCSRCRKELSISCFRKDNSNKDGLGAYCKKCNSAKDKQYYRRNIKQLRMKMRDRNNKERNTFQRKGKVRGNSGMLKRDYELTEEQLKRREQNREYRNNKGVKKGLYGILIWYDGKLNHLSSKEYERVMGKEYIRQKGCAIRGCVGKKQPSEHFLFDFDLEQMLEDNVYVGGGKYKYYITKWWKGEIRHWTVNDGIWKEG